MASGTQFPTNIDILDNFGQGANNVQTTLDGAIDAGDTSITVVDATGIPLTGGYFIVIESEIIFCIGRTGNVLNVDQRGADGTIAAAHADTTPVNMYIVAANQNDTLDALIAVQTEIGSDTPAVGTVKGRLSAAESNIISNDTDIGNLQTFDTQLQSNANGEGASLVGIEDPGGLITATDTEGALVENRTAINTNVTNIGTNTINIGTNATNISGNTNDIADIRSTTGTSDNDTDMGTYTDPKGVMTANDDIKGNIQSLIDYITHPNRREWVQNGGWSNLPSNGTEQISWGNKAGNDGWTADIDCEIIGMSIYIEPTTGSGTAELRAEINDVQQTGVNEVILMDGTVDTVELVARQRGARDLTLNTPIQITKGDKVHAVIVTSGWGNNNADGTITFRLRGR